VAAAATNVKNKISLFSMFSHMYVSGRGNQKNEEEREGERARERGDT
jgi:hypothetical protein